MTANQPDKKVVYLALKDVLQGPNALLRQKKAILKAIEPHRNQINIRSIIRKYDIERLCLVAQVLLKDEVFESTLKAKQCFPEVFRVSPGSSAKRAISESKAAKHEEAAIQSVIEGRQGQSSDRKVEPPSGDHVKTKQIVTRSKAPECPDKSHSTSNTDVTSLYPVYLPFGVRHQLLVKVQWILEQACFEFARKNLNDVLQHGEWDCAEAMELNWWSSILLTHEDKFTPMALAKIGKPLKDLLDSIAQLRHAAVHRVCLTANRVLEFINDAMSLAELIEDEDSIDELSLIRRQTQGTIEELERNKDMLESRLAETRRQLAAKRADLQRQEELEIENTIKGDREYAVIAGASLEQALNAPATVVHSPISTEDEFSSSDPEVDGVSSGDDVESCRKLMG